MELETNNVGSNVRKNQFRTKGFLTQPQLDVHNAIHSYSKQIKLITNNRTNSSSTNQTGSTAIIPIKANRYETNSIASNSSKTINHTKLLLNRDSTHNNNNNNKTISTNLLSITTSTSPVGSTQIKMNSNFIYQIPHQHRILNNISSVSDQTNMNSTQINKYQNIIENDENKMLLKLRSQTSQSSALVVKEIQQNNIQQKIKKPMKLNPLLKTNSFKLISQTNPKQIQNTQIINDNIDSNKLQFIALHKPLKPFKVSNNENLYKQPQNNKLNFLNDNKLTLFDANKLIPVTKHTNLTPTTTNKIVNNNNVRNSNAFKWSFNNNTNNNNSINSSVVHSNTTTLITSRQIFNDSSNNKSKGVKPHLDDIDEDYMDSIYTKSTFDKMKVNSNNNIDNFFKSEKIQNIKSKDVVADDSDNDTLVSSSSLLSTSDKSCEVIYLCPVNQKLQEERRKKAQINKYKFKLNRKNNVKPEDLFLNNNLSSSDEDEMNNNSKKDGNNNVVKNVKKNILTSLNKRLSANSNYE
jgi:hypothetical protein